MDPELQLGNEPGIDEVADAFLKAQADPAEVSEDQETEAEEEAIVEEEAKEIVEEETDEDSSDEGEESPAPLVADDEAEVTVSVDGVEHKIAVKDLKRLYGQEASLTTKSQALANQRRALDDQGLYVANLLKSRYDAAVTKAAKYKDVDLYQAAATLDPEEFQVLRAAKEGAESEVKALETEAKDFLTKTAETRKTVLREQAKEARKELLKHIPEWNDNLYNEVRTYAVAQGMDADVVNEIVDPAAILMINKARQFDALQAKKTTVTKKVTASPKKLIKKSASAERDAPNVTALRRAAQIDGDVDSVADLFLAASKK